LTAAATFPLNVDVLLSTHPIQREEPKLLVQYRLIPGCIVTLAALLTAARGVSNVSAATFRFDAQITSTSPGVPFDLPLTYQVGDIFHGQVTFEPSPGIAFGDRDVQAVQVGEFVFNFNDVFVNSSPYNFRVHDNTGFEDTDLGTVDVMMLHSLYAPDAQPPFMHLPDGEPFRVGVLMLLVGQEHSLPTLDIPGAIDVWNTFNVQRSLNISFDNEGPGSMGLQAKVLAFNQVPEPTTGLLLVFIALLRRPVDQEII
jgi:hypothetical protein